MPIAKGINQPKTSAGKLNGATPQKNPDRGLNHAAIDVVCDALDRLTLNQRRNRARHLNDLDDTADLTSRLSDVLTLVDGNGLGKGFQIVLQGLMHEVDVVHALRQRHGFPGGERSRGRGNRATGRLGRGNRHLTDDLAGGRVTERDILSTDLVFPLAIDMVLNTDGLRVHFHSSCGWF